MVSEEKLDKIIEDLFSEVKFEKQPLTLYEPLDYMIRIGGKRLRPKLCLLTYSLYKDYFDDAILQPATGLEIFHGFTLIHDDIMDKSPLRRGCESVWKKWDNDTAILSGDVMCIDSYRRISCAPDSKLREVLDLFSSTTAKVCEGQQYDKDFESREDVSMQEYMEMIGLKTAVLLACSAKMGALIAGASREDCDKLYDFAYLLGVAFQIEDDYLDAYGNEDIFGKPIGGDIINKKKNWLITRALEKIGARQRPRLISLYNEENIDREEKIAEVLEFYDSLGVGEEAKSEIKKIGDRAKETVKDLFDGEKYDMLCSQVSKLLFRQK